MQTELQTVASAKDLQIQVKTRRPRFKVGAEISGGVNHIDVDVEENDTETQESLAVSISIKRGSTAMIPGTQDPVQGGSAGGVLGGLIR